MVERTLIFNAKGFQLGYIEGDAAFDFNGTRRCSYAGATGNLCDLNKGNIVSHVSLDGTFVGATRMSDELFGRPNGDVQTEHPARIRSAHRGSWKASVHRPKNGAIETTALQQSNAGPAPAIYLDDPGTLSTSDQAGDDMHAESPSAPPCLESDPGAPDSVIPSAENSAAENELLDRAMSMIRSALVKGNRDGDA